MKKRVIPGLLALMTLVGATISPASESTLCKDSDRECLEFENNVRTGQFDKIIAKVDPTKQYSEGARHYLGMAYLALAGREENTPEQEEAYCRKALEYGSNEAYMGLYFIHAQKDPEEALGFLRQYIETKPADSVPYVILGETELGKKNYKLADFYLRESKKVARARSARVDWMLFQANYLLANYQYAGEILESVMANGKFNEELKALSTDERFQGIEKRPELRKFFTATNARE